MSLRIELRFWEIIEALEQSWKQQRGKTVLASRTRQKVKRVGVTKTVEDIVVGKKPSAGFHHLVEVNLHQHLFEYLVLECPEAFSPAAARAAELRLRDHGLPLAVAS